MDTKALPAGWRINMGTGLAVLFTVAVAVVTGKASWGHIVDIGVKVGEPSAEWLPVAVDGMMLACTALAFVDRQRGMVPRFWAVLGMWLGSALTLVFNVASALDRGWIACLIAVMYAVALLVVVEALFHPSGTYLADRRARRAPAALVIDQATTSPVPLAPVVAVPAPVTVPAPVEPEPTPVVEPEETVTAAPEPAPARKRRARKGTGYPAPTDAELDALQAAVRAGEPADAMVV